MSQQTINKLSLQSLVGKGYAEYWHCKCRYRVVKGSRASKKSKTTALYFISQLMKYPEANLLVVRKTYATLKNSCFSDLLWAIHKLQVDEYWKYTNSPLEITYLPTGQKILFRGLDDPLKVTSISVDTGYLVWCWIEEAYEITDEDSFNMLDESIRGKVPDYLFKQITLTFNPWNEKHWLKRRFFDTPNDDTKFAMTTNYMCNEWLDKADLKLFEDMKVNNPRRYQVAGLGNWGIVDGLIYENWKEEAFELISQADYLNLEDKTGNYIIKDKLQSAFGLDFGYTNDPSALFCGAIDLDNKKIYVFNEMYEKGLSNRRIYENIAELGYLKEFITGDSAEPKSIDELRSYGLRIRGATKGKDSIMNGIQFIQDFEIIIHPRCVNFLTEIGNYTWDKDKFGSKLNRPIDDFCHLLDAMRYACEKYIRKSRWIY